jgi:hypothetical protein
MAAHAFIGRMQQVCSLPRRVETPEWSQSTPDSMQAPVRDFDITAIHSRAEIWELRIVSGKDARYRHPAMATTAAAENELSKEERGRIMRYREKGLLSDRRHSGREGNGIVN